MKKVKAEGERVANRGPNPQERITVGMKLPGPGRFIHVSPTAQGPTRGPQGAREDRTITAQPKGSSREA